MESLDQGVKRKFNVQIVTTLAQQAHLAQLRGDIDLAAHLFGVSDTWHRDVHRVIWQQALHEFDRTITAARAVLMGPAWEEGRRWTLDQAVAACQRVVLNA